MAKSLNVLWLISAGSLEDPFCLMEVCAAVRQGTPVLPVRLAGVGMKPLNLPIWACSIATQSSRSVADNKGQNSSSDEAPGTTNSSPAADDHGADAGGGHELATVGGDEFKTAAETSEKAHRLRRRAADGFYAQLAQHLPKSVQVELHRNNFLVRDVIAAVRACFESAAEEADISPDEKKVASASDPKPPVYDLSAPPSDQEKVLTALVGADRATKRQKGVSDDADREEGTGSPLLWNWEQIPRHAPLAGRASVNGAVPWRTSEETAEMIKMENAEADDLAGERGTQPSVGGRWLCWYTFRHVLQECLLVNTFTATSVRPGVQENGWRPWLDSCAPPSRKPIRSGGDLGQPCPCLSVSPICPTTLPPPD